MNRSEHEYEAAYEIWRRGYNPDNLDPDQSDQDYYYDGLEAEETAQREINRQVKFQTKEQ